ELSELDVGFSGGAAALRERGDFAGAEMLLREAIERFPSKPGALIDFAALAQRNRDWTEAARRWEAVKERFPELPAGYTGAANVMRELGHFDAADALLAQAVERFPGEAEPLWSYAWLATI